MVRSVPRHVFTMVSLIIFWGGLLAGNYPGQCKTTIVYQYNWSSWSDPWYDEAFIAVINRFNATHRDIEVKGIRVPGVYDKLLVSIAAGTAPDVVHFEASAVVEWANKGLLMPLDQLYSVEQLKREFVSGQVEESIFEGHVWAIPWATDVRGLFWNADLFEEVGLDGDKGPSSIDELNTFANKITRVNSEGMFTQLGFVPWVGNWHPPGWFWAFGGGIYDAVKKQPTLDRVENIKALEWVQGFAKLYPPQRFAIGSLGLDRDPKNAFIMGRLGMYPGYHGSIRLINEAAPDLNYRTGAVPYMPNGTNGTWTGGMAHVIPKGTKHPKEAMEFLKWLASPEAQILYCGITTLSAQLPTNRKAFEDALEQFKKKGDRKERSLIPLLTQLPVAHGRPPLWAKVVGWLATAQSTDIITLKRAPREVLEGLQRQALPEYERLFGK